MWTQSKVEQTRPLVDASSKLRPFIFELLWEGLDTAYTECLELQKVASNREHLSVTNFDFLNAHAWNWCHNICGPRLGDR